MATLHHFHNYSSVTFRKPLCHPTVYSSNAQCCRYQQSYSTIYACSSKKPRGKRKAKSNADLCSEIRNFLSTVGLPENHVPSLKELSQNGRQDLSNIVRRRGYKFVRQLLEAPMETISNASPTVSTYQTNSEGQDENPKALPNNISAGEAVKRTSFNDNPHTRKELKVNGKSSFAVDSTTLRLEEKLAKFIDLSELKTIEDSGLGIGHANVEGQESDSDYPQVERTSSEEDLADEKLMKEAEVKRLGFTLHQREGELTELKQQIEKEELALSVLQTKAKKEISNVQALLSETDIELHAIEECLSGLKEVEIQYSGGGENLELAGSFDGWHRKIKMDLAPSSSVKAPTRSRTSRLWITVLWLYPGVYEIKFIVDGRWTIDPQRESVFRGFTHNNILHVQ